MSLVRRPLPSPGVVDTWPHRLTQRHPSPEQVETFYHDSGRFLHRSIFWRHQRMLAQEDDEVGDAAASWSSGDFWGCLSCGFALGPAPAARHRRSPLSPARHAASASTPLHLVRACQKRHPVPWVSKRPHRSRQALGCAPMRYPRPPDAPVRSTPRCMAVRMPPVTSEGGWAWGTAAPMAIPGVAPGGRSTALPAPTTLWRRMAPSFMANGQRWS